MTYTELVVGAIVLAALGDLAVLRTGLLRRRAFWTAYAIMAGFQLIVNGILAGIPVVRYNQSAILGVRVVFAPIEDLGFGFALILSTLACWVAVERRERRPGPAA